MKKNIIRRGISLLKRRGVRGVVEKVNVIPRKDELIHNMQYIMEQEEIPLDVEAMERHKKDEVKLLNWVIPEMGKGSGGHTTIFRMMSHLENMGYHSRVYLFYSPNYRDNQSVVAFVREHFPLLDHRVELFWDLSQLTYAHATFATSWETAYYVRRYKNTSVRCYFVQDFEPFFFPNGSYYHLAENTYRFGFYGITAGDWLKEKLNKEYGMWTRSFGFSYDKEVYKASVKNEFSKKIFFYARPYTPRRDFEIGLLALDAVCKRMEDVTVVFAGEDISNYVIPFKHENHGIVTVEALASFYAECDMCLVISGTNLSLLPLEIMGSNSVAICSKGDNSSWLVNEENAIMVDYDPVEIANTMIAYYNRPEELALIREKGLAFARQTAWEKEAEKIKVALGEIL
ncbi:MAG: glycosyltransferase family 1 protein [Lachnospiraceae bacterium]|nr:glycosyltransferase family 1 protein [Lachnospiraceae bacterium]